MKYSVHAERAKLEKNRNNHPPRLSELSGRSLIGAHPTATPSRYRRTIRRPCWHLKPIYNNGTRARSRRAIHLMSQGNRIKIRGLS